MPIAFLKKSRFTGSQLKMRYLMQKSEVDGEEKLETVTWPQPFNDEKTEEALKNRRLFAFTEDGIKDAVAWLNEQQELYQ